MQHNNVLTQAVFLTGQPRGEGALLSLPQVLARLCAGEPLEFPRLRPHQRAAWHAFLVQLAYLALEGEEAESAESLPTAEADWQHLLRRLAPAESAWCLIEPDWQQPAFLQSPCPRGREGDYKRGADAAQDVDVLVTSRHHDEKTGKLPLDTQALDVLVYALVMLQGWSGYFGSGNYNAMRMNGGHSSRSQLRLAFERGPCAEFTRDLIALLQGRDALQRRVEGAGGIGSGSHPLHRLLWLPTWGDEPLSLQSVHPYSLEVCRRVRLVERDGRLNLMAARSKSMRVAAEDACGVVLDPWTLVVRNGPEPPKALTAQAHTLGYRSLQNLLFNATGAEMPLLAQMTPMERAQPPRGAATLLMNVLVIGNGRSHGLRQREILVPAISLRRFADRDALLGLRSQQFVELSGHVARALRAALLQFMDGRAGKDVGSKNRDFKRWAEIGTQRFDAEVDQRFFGHLFSSFERDLEDVAAQAEWVGALAALAKTVLDEATRHLPTRDDTRWFARVRAEQLLLTELRAEPVGALLAVTEKPGAKEETNV